MATGSNVAVPMGPIHIDGARNAAVQSTSCPRGHGCRLLSFSLGAETPDSLTPAPMRSAQCTQQVTRMVFCQEMSLRQPLPPAPDCTKTFLASLEILAFTGPLLTKAGRPVSLEQHCLG